jgi:hypothetical protein
MKLQPTTKILYQCNQNLIMLNLGILKNIFTIINLAKANYISRKLHQVMMGGHLLL